jgi:hypothetical protein
MGILDEEFYCEKCNWFTYRHSPVPYIKPAPRCPRCGLETRIATVGDGARTPLCTKGWSYIDNMGLSQTVEQASEVDIRAALEMSRDFCDTGRQSKAIVPRRDVLKQAEIANRRCRECKIILLNGDDTGLCDVCLTMFNAIAHQPRLLEAHVQWEVENQRRITQKQRLMRD